MLIILGAMVEQGLAQIPRCKIPGLTSTKANSSPDPPAIVPHQVSCSDNRSHDAVKCTEAPYFWILLEFFTALSFSIKLSLATYVHVEGTNKL